MVAALLLSATLLLGETPAVSPNDFASYASAKAGVGGDADAQARLALWCEAHGLLAERMRHLALAVLRDPRHALARGLMGLVDEKGRWRRPADVAEKAKADTLLREYSERRSKTPNTADAQWKLALWCEENALKAEASAHLRIVTRLEPAREAVWKRLGYKRHAGLWVTDAQIAAAREEAVLQKKADRHWKPILEKWRDWLGSKTKRSEAEGALAEVTDPRAVPMVCAVFATGGTKRQAIAVQLLGQIDAPRSSRALAMLAVGSDSADVRRTATEILKRRDVREFADLLVALLRDPIKYEVRPVKGPGSPGELYIEGKKANVKRLYSPPPGPNVALGPMDQIGLDNYGLPVVGLYQGLVGQSGWITAPQIFAPYRPQFNPSQDRQFLSLMAGSGLGAHGARIGQMLLNARNDAYNTMPLPYQMIALASLETTPGSPITQFDFLLGNQLIVPVGQMQMEANKTAAVAQQQLQRDVQAIDAHNAPMKQLNARVLPVLKEVSGQDLGESQESWGKWWIDQTGYAAMTPENADTPTIIEQVPLAYQPQPVPIDSEIGVVGFQRMSCFGAGTPVHTRSGIQPIESLREGDQVLTQDIKTGALGYQPILVVHRNPPSKTFRIVLNDETIVSSEFHRFWKAGQGWVMARDLKTGDCLRMLDGVAEVTTIDPGAVQPVFNLDIAENADFFAGRRGALVHDNTLPDLRLAPFDAVAVLAGSESAVVVPQAPRQTRRSLK